MSATGSKLWLALGAIGCLAGGAAATWLLASNRTAEQEAAQARPTDGPLHGPPIAARPVHPIAVQPVAINDSGKDSATVTFDVLSGFYYGLTDAADRPKDQIPAPVRALDGKKVAIQGFMVPIKLKNGGAKEFLITKDQTICCGWGRIPRMNEWISVKMTDQRTTRCIADQPVTVAGTLHVGEEIENGEVLSVYRMDADDLAGPLDP